MNLSLTATGLLNHTLAILQEPLFLMGLFSALGLILQKKSRLVVLKGTTVTMLGFLALQTGIKLALGSLKVLTALLNESFQLQGAVSKSSMMTSMAFHEFGSIMPLVVVGSFGANLLFARITPWKYVYLSHNWIFLSAVVTIMLSLLSLPAFLIVVLGSLLVGFLMVFFPALIQPYTRQVTKTDSIALGHLSTLSNLLSAYVGSKIGNKNHSTESLFLSKNMQEIKGDQYGYSYVASITTITMLILFLLTSFVAGTDFTQNLAGKESWLLFISREAFIFGAGFLIALTGVSMFVGQLITSFKGISDKLIPHAIPALDADMLLQYAPTAAFLGAMMSFVGGLLAMGLQISMGWIVVLPIIHFVTGAAAGIYGNATGGVRGAIVGSLLQGFLVTLLGGAFIPLLAGLGENVMTFTHPDALVTGFLLSLPRLFF